MKKAALSLCVVGTLVVGCAGSGDEGPKVPNMPAPPAPVPKASARPLDPALRQSAEAEIASAFNAADPVLRANALEAGQRVNSAAAAERTGRGLTDGNPVVRFAAAMAAGASGDRRNYARLLELAKDPAPTVRVGALYALHKLGDHRQSHDFEKLIQDRDARVRANTVMALGLLGEPSAMKLLSVTETDPIPAVRLQTTEAMYRLGSEVAADRLMVCLLALAQGRSPTDKVYKILQGNLTGDYVEVTLAAARAMGIIGSDEGMGVALAAVPSKAPRQRAMAALALGAIGRADAQPQLAKLLKDADPNVRLAAATAVLQLKS